MLPSIFIIPDECLFLIEIIKALYCYIRVRVRVRLLLLFHVLRNIRKLVNEFLVSKETVVLRRWERSKQKFGFIKRVDKGRITTVKDLES